MKTLGILLVGLTLVAACQNTPENKDDGKSLASEDGKI